MNEIEKLREEIKEIKKFLDRNKDGKLDTTDTVHALKDALQESQKNSRDMIDNMQKNFNENLENFQKRTILDKLIWILGSIGVFLFSVLT